MAAQPATSPPRPGTDQPDIPLPVHRMDVDSYNQIVEAGVLAGQRVELLEGLIVDMSPQSIPHTVVLERLTDHFRRAPVRLRVQMPFEIRPNNEPEPDLALVEETLSHEHQPRTALLVVEVAVSSHMIDRNVKARYYARANIPIYWLIDVPARAVEVRTEPGSDGYGQCQTYRDGDTVASPVSRVDDLDISALFAD